MKLIPFLILLLIIRTAVSGQTILWDSVRPHATDANIEEGPYNLRHYIARSDQDTMNTLVLVLPGTYRAPSNYKFLTEQLAGMGYHVLGLMYRTEPPVGPLCRATDDVTCHWRARMETIDGIDRHSGVLVNVPNSIINRLQKVLQYLITSQPDAGWEQFYSSGQIQWNNIVVTGHSQGASLSGILGKEFPVKRVVMWSAMDFLNSGNIPDWVADPTNNEKFYAFIHPKDELVPFTIAQLGWDKLGMTAYGSMSPIDCIQPTFADSRILYTMYNPASTLVDKYHNGTILDIYINGETAYKNALKEAVQYLFKK